MIEEMIEEERYCDSHDEVKLRHDGPKRIMAPIPSGLVVFGIAVIVLILIGLVLAVMLIPYPYSEGESILRHMTGQ